MRRIHLTALCLASVSAIVCPQLRAQQPPGTPPPPPTTPAAEPPKEPEPVPVTVKPLQGKGLMFQLGESTLKIGGYVKVDLIHDFDRIGSAESFDPRTIDTHGLDGENTVMTARESRINLDLRTPTDLGELKTFVEGDFASSSNGFRLRHAYGSVDHFLGGQTWSTFMDEDAMPSTLDFESPIAFPLSRVAQVRYTQNFDSGNYFAVALENPNNSISAPAVPGIEQDPIPDLTARIRMNNERGHVQLGLFGGMASFQPDTGSSDDVVLWGANLSAKETTWGKDYALVQLTYGEGVGAFRGGIAAAPDSNGDLEAVPTAAYMLGYQHYWSEKYRSTVVYSAADGDLPNGSAIDATEEVSYAAANLIWQFCNRAWVGIEYLHGYRDTFSDGDGSADRLQMSMRFDI